MTSSPGVLFKRLVIFVHRWLGVALCLVFLLWFPSGIAMMYWDFPSVDGDDRLEHSPALDRATIRLSPAEAYARLEASGEPGQVSLGTFDGRPVYRFRSRGDESVVYADTGEELLAISPEMVRRIASAWAGQPASAAQITAVDEADQWTLQIPVARLAPVWKYSWPDGQQVYISEALGEVLQYTTTASRWGAYAGAIPHWLYFPPLRRHGLQWSTVVIWSSGIGTGAALLGIVIGIWMYSPSKRYRHAGVPTGIPYRGQKRWHAVLGLVFGVGAVTWAFSGMLSMEPFPLNGEPSGDGGRNVAGSIVRALGGDAPMAAFAGKDPRVALAELGSLPVKELEMTAFDGTPVYLATIDSRETRIVPVNGAPRTDLGSQSIVDLVTAAAGPDGLADIRVLDQYDRYYLDRRRQRPLPVVMARLNDPDQTRLYIDPKTARIVGNYGASTWATRWLYHGLHSLDFPWLYNYRPAWDIVVITFMLGGTALCVTSLVLAWRVIGRTLQRMLPAGTGRPAAVLGDDLAVD